LPAIRTVVSTHIGEEARDDQSADPSAPELEFQRHANESTVDVFFDNDLIVMRLKALLLNSSPKGELQR
jgi:hypothetical protein